MSITVLRAPDVPSRNMIKYEPTEPRIYQLSPAATGRICACCRSFFLHQLPKKAIPDDTRLLERCTATGLDFGVCWRWWNVLAQRGHRASHRQSQSSMHGWWKRWEQGSCRYAESTPRESRQTMQVLGTCPVAVRSRCQCHRHATC